MENHNDFITALGLSEESTRCLESIPGFQGGVSGIIVIGKTGAGKSSLVELVTDSTGLSGDTLVPVTAKCEIRKALVGGRSYFLIDTPGFDDERDAWDTSIHITKTVDAMRKLGATIAGIWCVIDNSRLRDQEIDARLCNWLVEFCGRDFFPNLTFVTTFWDYTDARKGKALSTRLAGRQALWREFLDGGAKTYQHGKLYDENGKETPQVLLWDDQRENLASQAKDMLSRFYRDVPTIQPQIVRELDLGASCEEVSVANVFRPALATPHPATGQSSVDPQGTIAHFDSSEVAPVAQTLQSQTPTEINDHPTQGSASAEQPSSAATTQQADQAPPSGSSDQVPQGDGQGPSILSTMFQIARTLDSNFNIRERIARTAWDALEARLQQGPVSITQSSGSMQLKPRESAVDLLKFFGQDSSLERRQDWANILGITGEPGSLEWGRDLHQGLMSLVVQDRGALPF